MHRVSHRKWCGLDVFTIGVILRRPSRCHRCGCNRLLRIIIIHNIAHPFEVINVISFG